jgi:hypothetical protein
MRPFLMDSAMTRRQVHVSCAAQAAFPTARIADYRVID